MAAYCTKADLVERFGTSELAQLTDETAHATPDDSEIDKACDEASSLVDSYLATRYPTPLVAVPTVVRTWAVNIARKFLWKDRATDESIVKRNYDDALAQLRDVAKGVAALSVEAGPIDVASGTSIRVVTSEQVFTDELLGLMP